MKLNFLLISLFLFVLKIKSADINFEDIIENGNISQLLTSLNQIPNQQEFIDNNGLLNLATLNRQLDMAELLILRGATIDNIFDNTSPLDDALSVLNIDEINTINMIKLLLQHHATFSKRILEEDFDETIDIIIKEIQEETFLPLVSELIEIFKEIKYKYPAKELKINKLLITLYKKEQEKKRLEDFMKEFELVIMK